MPPSTSTPVSSGKRFSSVDALLKQQQPDPALLEMLEVLRKESKVVRRLTLMRHAAGITQTQMATALGVTQPAVSKLESGKDEDLTLREISVYSKICGERVNVHFGKPMNHVESVKTHAFAMRHHLTCLAEMANKHDELEKDIAAFFGEAFFNILNLLVECHDQLPTSANGEDDCGFTLDSASCGPGNRSLKSAGELMPA